MYRLPWYATSLRVEAVPAEYDRIYQSTLHLEEYTVHFLLGALSGGGAVGDEGSDELPYAVSVVVEPCGPPSNHLHVSAPSAATIAGTFAVCTSALYNVYDDRVRKAESPSTTSRWAPPWSLKQ